MSELIQKHDNRATMRWKLLTGVSALALTAYVSSASVASAEDSSRPQIWIELGGQLSGLDDGQEAFAPALMAASRPSVFSPSQKFEKPPLYSIDETGAISFQPYDSNWILSASVRYGRSASSHQVRQQATPQPFHFTLGGQHYTDFPLALKFADTNAQTSQNHLIMDFQAGKDVGLGMFGSKDGSSVVSLGVRFAQFRSKLNSILKSDPDAHFHYKYFYGYKLVQGQTYHSNAASFRAKRSFHGVGPSISWNASAPLAGNVRDGELTFDWGVNAALLFGRQRSTVHHQTTARYHGAKYYKGLRAIVGTSINTNHTRARSVTVPNVDGFAGLSFTYADAKMSFGYRADMFFGAMDGGIDSRKNENRGFYGPFVSISVGLGD